MGKLFLITYDLKKPGQNYTELYDAIKNLGDWQHPLESTWVVKVSSFITAEDIYARIHPTMDKSDYLFVVDITDKNYYGWLSRNFWSWINN